MYEDVFILAPALARACARMGCCKTLYNALSRAKIGGWLEKHLIATTAVSASS